MLTATALLVGAGPARRVLEAERFSFRDSSGKERLSLDSTAQGPTCVINDAAGKPAFKVVIDKEGYFQMPTPVATPPAHKAPAK